MFTWFTGSVVDGSGGSGSSITSESEYGSGSESRVLMTKIEKEIQQEKNYIFLSKMQFTYP
jgi:hypothetical protein